MEVLYKKAVLKYFAIFIGKHLCWRFFSIKLWAFRFAGLKNICNGCFFNLAKSSITDITLWCFIANHIFIVYWQYAFTCWVKEKKFYPGNIYLFKVYDRNTRNQWYMLKVNNENTRDIVLKFSLLAMSIFQTFSIVSIVDFEQVNVIWVAT